MHLPALAFASSAVLLVFVAIVLAGIARAPGWERSRTFAIVAATAAVYAMGDLVNVSQLPLEVRLWASRVQYAVGALHAGAWMRFSFPGDEPGQGPLARRLLFGGMLTLAVLALVPGALVGDAARFLDVPAFSTRYTIFPLNAFGSAGGVLMLLAIGLAFHRVSREPWGGAGIPVTGRAGFVVFFACAASDLATPSGFLHFMPLAGVGFVAALLPVAMHMIGEFVRSARRLDHLSRELSAEVRDRTHEVLRVQRELAEAERHASIGRVAAAAAHDINNPLAWLILNTDLLRDATAGQSLADGARESIEGIVEGAERIKAAVEALRARTRWSPGMRVVVAPDRLLRVALKAATGDLHRAFQVSVDIQPIPLVAADEGDLMSLLADLLTLAQEAPAGGRVNGALSVRADTGDDGWARVTMELRYGNTGLYAIPRCGDSSISLAMLQDVATRHGGSLVVDEVLGYWSAVLRLPPSSALVTSDGRVGGALAGAVGQG